MGPVFELFATLGLNSNDFDSQLNASEKKASDFGDKLKSGLATAAKVSGAAIAAASAAVVKLGTEAVKGYADFEQLAGGIETLFKTPAIGIEEYAKQQGVSIEKAIDGYRDYINVSDKVLKNASKAFKTAGMSANEYMDIAIQSSAALINSLGGDTVKAADLMDLSIVDMSDNVNKMGTTMEAVQNAYRGFSRGNFTMLDNLALGFSGTKEGMQELLDKATELSGVEYDISSYADIVQAIHVVQENMGIAGTTAQEASETISGSVSSMKAAWQNLLVGMADPAADLSGLIGNVVDTAETAFGNILPVAEQALMGIATFVEEIAPVIAEKLPGLVEAVLPSVLNAATSLVTALVDALPTLMQVLIDQGPVIVNTLLDKILEMLPEVVALGLTLLTSLAQGIADNLDELIPTVVDVVLEIVDTLTDPETLGNLIDAAIAIMIALANGLIKSLPKLAEKAPQIIQHLVDALVENLPKLLVASVQIMVELAKGIIDNLPEIFNAAGKIVAEIIAGIGNALSGLFTAGKDALLKIKEGFDSFDPKQWGKDMIENFVGGITSKWEDLKSSVRGVAQTVKDILGFSEPKEGPLSDFHTYAPDMMELFAKGIRDNEHLITDQLEDSFDFRPKIAAASTSGLGGTGGPSTIIVQSVLDGRVIGETAYRYSQNRLRTVGG